MFLQSLPSQEQVELIAGLNTAQLLALISLSLVILGYMTVRYLLGRNEKAQEQILKMAELLVRSQEDRKDLDGLREELRKHIGDSVSGFASLNPLVVKLISTLEETQKVMAAVKEHLPSGGSTIGGRSHR